MTGPNDTPPPTAAEQAELDAWVAAEEVANDYHEDDPPSDRVRS